MEADLDKSLISGEVFNQFFAGRKLVEIIENFGSTTYNYGYQPAYSSYNKRELGINTRKLFTDHTISGGFTVYFIEKFCKGLTTYTCKQSSFCYELQIEDDAQVYIDGDKIMVDKINVISESKLDELSEWDNDEFCKTATMQWPGSSIFFKTKLTYDAKQLILDAVRKNPFAIADVLNPSVALCKEVLDLNPETFKHMKNPPDAVKLYAIQKDPKNAHIAGRMENSTWKLALKIDYTIIQFTGLQAVPELCIAALQVNGLSLAHITNPTEYYCKLAVEQTPMALEFVPVMWRSFDMCTKAVIKDPKAIQFVPADRQSEDLCFIAVRFSGTLIKYAKIITPRVYDEALKTWAGASIYGDLLVTGDNEETIIAAIKKNPELILNIRRPSKQVIIEACRRNPSLIESVDTYSLTDDVCLELVKLNPHILKFILPKKAATQEMYRLSLAADGSYLKNIVNQTDDDCWYATQQSPDNLQFVQEKNQTKFLCLNVVSRKGECIAHVKIQTAELCSAAIMNDPKAIRHIKKPTKEMWEVAIREEPNILETIGDQTEEMCLIAVTINGEAIQHVKNQTLAIQKAAIKQNPYAIRFIKKPSDELCMEALKENPKVLGFIQNQTMDMCFYAVEKDHSTIQDFNEKSQEMCIFAILVNPEAYDYVVDNETKALVMEMFRHFVTIG